MANLKHQVQEHTKQGQAAQLNHNGGKKQYTPCTHMLDRFGTADRDGLYGTSAAPGPGAYTHSTQFGGQGKGMSMTPKRPLSGTNHGPGPGSYEFSLADKSKGPSYR